MNPEKKQLEILLIDYFKDVYEDFPKSSITASESPDFILTLKNRHQLGLELTRLNPGNASPPDLNHIEENRKKDHFIEMVREIVEKNKPHQLFVKFLFSGKEEIASQKELMSAVQVAGTIRKFIGKKKTESFFKLIIPRSKLPAGLDEILVLNHPALEKPVWERSNNLGISGDVIDDIRNSILKKEEKLRLYQKQRLNYYWLLIVTDRLRGIKNFNIQNQVRNHIFSSRFQHVYLFDLIKSDIFELV